MSNGKNHICGYCFSQDKDHCCCEPFSHVNSKNVRYYLNKKDVTLRGGKEHTIYYFSIDVRPEGVKKLPDDMVINENPRNGFLTVKRIEKDCGSCECDEGCEEDSGNRIRDSFEKDMKEKAIAEELYRKIQEAEKVKASQWSVKRRVLVEELKSTVDDGKTGESDTVRVEYEYGPDNVVRSFVDSETPKRVRIVNEQSVYSPSSGQVFNKTQLKAHIQNLEEILDRI